MRTGHLVPLSKWGLEGGGGGYQARHDTRLCHALDLIYILSSEFSRYE